MFYFIELVFQDGGVMARMPLRGDEGVVWMCLSWFCLSLLPLRPAHAWRVIDAKGQSHCYFGLSNSLPLIVILLIKYNEMTIEYHTEQNVSLANVLCALPKWLLRVVWALKVWWLYRERSRHSILVGIYPCSMQSTICPKWNKVEILE